MGLVDDNLAWDVTITNNGIVGYFEALSKTTIKAGKTATFRVGSTLLANQILSNVKQANDLKKENLLVATKQVVAQSGEVDLTDYYTKDEVDQIIADVPGGGGNYSFSIKELSLVDTAEKIPSLIHNTADVNNELIGTSSKGLVYAEPGTSLSAYFKCRTGKLSLTIDFSTHEVLILEISNNLPIKKRTFAEASIDPNFFGIGVIPQGANLLIGYGNMFSDNASIIFLTPAQAQEEIIFELNENKIDVYNKGIQLGSFAHNGEIGHYFQTICEVEEQNTTTIRFDLSGCFESINYKLPDDSKDGDIFHLTTKGELFGHELLVGDYITLYGDKSNIAINRLQEPLKIPPNKVEIPITLHNQNGGTAGTLQAFYDSELKSIFLVGSFYFSENPADARVCTLDMSKIPYFQLFKSLNFYYINRNGVFYLFATYDGFNGSLTIRIQEAEAPAIYTACSVPLTRVAYL